MKRMLLMIFNPLKVFNTVSKSYEDYVKSTFYITDKEFREQFNKLVDEKGFTKGPIIECTDSFLTGDSIAELINKKVLNFSFHKIIKKESELQRGLYRHQIEAIEKCNQDKNIVVTTGTGSGKTECFLYPILNSLLNEIDNNSLTPGVRALLLYPMNALANDQMKRLRKLLADVPQITFGVYTGETENSYKKALTKYQDLFHNQPCANELISREQMKEMPPHILLTNYAMLEYLLLRPNDTVFFDGERALHWKYIVLDEAHSYRGASGIEISYLIRRLYHRLQNREKIRFILTSATLGGKEKDNQIIEFAENISAGTKYYIEDIIRAQREKRISLESQEETRNLKIYNKLLSYLETLDDIDKADLIKVQDYFCQHSSNEKNVREYLGKVIREDSLYNRIRNYLQEKCTDLYTLASDFSIDPEDLSAFLTVAGLAQENSLKLIDIRYHTFIRSLEGVYITFSPNKTLTLVPRKKHVVNEEDFTCFKLSVCQFCGQMYLEGNRRENVFSQPETHRTVIYQILDDNDIENYKDMPEENDQISKLFSLCTKCSKISEYNGKKKCFECSCNSEYTIILLEVEFNDDDPVLHACKKCQGINARGSILRGFYIGSNAASSIIGSSMFEHIPFKKINFAKETKSLMGYKPKEDPQRETKRLLVFSDNRQDAAFFAVYLQSTYLNLLKRRLLLKTIREEAQRNPGKEIFLLKIADELARNFELKKIIDIIDTDSEPDPKREAWKTLLYEMQTGDRNGLVNLGFIQFKYKSYFNSPFGHFTVDELINIDELLMDSFLRDGAISIPVKLTAADYKEVLFQKSPAVFIKEKSNSYKNSNNIHFWVGKNNRRIQLLRKTERFSNDDDIRIFLSDIWDARFDYIADNILEQVDMGFQLNPKYITIDVSGLTNFKHMRCTTCGKVSPSNFFNKCINNRCSGILSKTDEVEFKTYQKENIEKENLFAMIVKEHTAQLSHKKAAEYQEEFIKGKTHVLSCSTTFEMGVDVGDLEAVFMRNMPPTPANYIQRAGRAGRNIKSTAFALTFCKLASHDLMFFQNPVKMVKGVVSPPSFKMTNDKIAARHIYSVLLGAFWQTLPNIKSIGDFFKKENYEAYHDFLDNSSNQVISYIKNFTNNLYSIENIKEFIQEYKKKDGLLALNFFQYNQDINLVNQLIDDKYSRRESKGIDQLERARNTMETQKIISFFSRNNLIPKYGFPVDTIELYTNLCYQLSSYSNTSDLKLQRDLSLAISEYAPGSEIIANGKMYKSEYIKTAPEKSKTWRQFAYAECTNPKCRHLNTVEYYEIEVHAIESHKCSECKQGLNLSNVFIIPDYGFITSNDNPDKAMTRTPIRTSKAKTYYLGSSDLHNGRTKNINTSNGLISIIQKSNDKFTTLNPQKYFVCHSCGYSITSDKSNSFFKTKIKEHKNSMGYPCKNTKLFQKSLGYIFRTDAIAMTFNQPSNDNDYSILFSLLEGISRFFDIERNDINGTLTYGLNENHHWIVYFIFYDTVPGGAGHTKRIIDANDDTVLKFLLESYYVVNNCTCGDNGDGEGACYSCLCNYYNQIYHEKLNRNSARQFLYPYISEYISLT